MTERGTEAFCERCGTRYTFGVPRAGGMARLRAASRGLRDYVLADHRSLGDAMADALGSADAHEAVRRTDTFQRTFSFCLDCRGYVCPDCWDAAAGRCVSCVDAAAVAAASTGTGGPDAAVDAREAVPGTAIEAPWPGADIPGIEPPPAPAWIPSPEPAPLPDDDVEADVIAAAIAAGIIHAAPLTVPPPPAVEAAEEFEQPVVASEGPDADALAARLAGLPTIGSRSVERPTGRPSFASGIPPSADAAEPWAGLPPTGPTDPPPADAPLAAAPVAAAAFAATTAPTWDASPTTARPIPPTVVEPAGAAIEPEPAGGPGAPPPSDGPGGPAPSLDASPGVRLVGRPSLPQDKPGAAKACAGCGLQLGAATRFCRRCGARQDGA
jgi:hypothetical protein